MINVRIHPKLAEAIAASRAEYNNGKTPDKQFMTDEDYAAAIVSFALKQHLGIKEEMGSRPGPDTLEDQLERERKGGLASGGPVSADAEKAGRDVNPLPKGQLESVKPVKPEGQKP